MRFTPEFLDEIKNRIVVSDVVGRVVKLRKAGREWRGLSPFNSEKTPSFFVNDAKMAWFDFSSGRNGNIFDFLMATQGLSFPEAVERLAGEAGLDLPRSTPEAAAREEKRAGLAEVLELACGFFERTLGERAGGKARAYLDGRAIGPDRRREFRLGYAPAERFALRDFLAGKGASAETMIEAGLLVHGEGIAVPYDRFRDRVMFPIADRGGRIIAFGGRALDPGAPAKYLNSPETPLFHKGANLYNQHRARKAAADLGTVISVEGYVDVIALASAGFANVVAGLGTALTAEQCELLWRLAPEPVLCFDGDAAGRRAAFKALDTALPLLGPSKTFRFGFLPEGQDPDDLVRAAGRTGMEDVLGQARPFVDVVWMRETEGAPLDTPEQRAALERRLSEIVRTIGDEPLRRHYGAELRHRLDAARWRGERQPRREARSFPTAAGPGRARPGKPSRIGYLGAAPPPLSPSLTQTFQIQRGAWPRREVEIVTLVLNHPSLLERHAEDLAHLDLGHPDLAGLRDLLVALSVDSPDTHIALKTAVDARGGAQARRRVEAAADRLPLWSNRPDADPADADLVFRQALALHRRARELHREMKQAELALAQEASPQHQSRVFDLQKLLSTVEGTEASIEGFGTLSGRRPAGV